MNIVIIGAGNGGKKIIESFSDSKDVNIRMIIDRDQNAPGMILAKEKGIPFSCSIREINCTGVDIIIEVTGNRNVQRDIEEHFGGNCTIMDSKSALLLMSLAEENVQKVEQLNQQVEVIKGTTDVVKDKVTSVVVSNNDLKESAESLEKFTKISDQYILEINNIIQYVNNIAKKTKILGINATIESARAGESGKAFSVVAKEIQGLANNTEANSKNIEVILVKLSKAIKDLSSMTSDLEGISKNQVEALHQVDNALGQLMTQVN